ncbi:hypothetical protein BJV78DRAFT_117350 [Lactifluus subvellereus]|nr:hypothetical protein BJV78DRAFT_117350 [Lactifluus subvellereus]
MVHRPFAKVRRGPDLMSIFITVPPHSAIKALGRSTTSSPRQYTQSDESDSEVEKKTYPNDNETASAQVPRDNLRMNYQHRRGTSSSSQTAYGDPSARIWGLYLSQAKKIDKEHSDSWTANTDGVLVFSGLFSATVAAFILTSYQSLQPNPSDTTNRLLFQISQQLSALSNGTPMSGPLILPDKSSFQPTASAVRVNVLWFTSLALSTVCALWATLMQQWTRRYVQAVDRPYAPPNRARIRAFFAEGVQKFGLGAAVEMLPGLLHTSFVLFYIGLVDFFYNINDTVAHCLLTLVALGVLLYVVLSIMPLFYPNSPYQTPLSTVLWFVMEAAPLVKHWLRSQTVVMQERQKKIGQGMRRALEKRAPNNWQVDARALRWTLNSLDGDRELEEEFLDALPGVFRDSTSQESQDPRKKMHEAVKLVAHELLATCSTGLLPEPARKQRLTACLGAIWCFRETTKRHCDAIWDSGARRQTTRGGHSRPRHGQWQQAGRWTRTLSSHFVPIVPRR